MIGLDDDEVFRPAWCQACEEKQAEIERLGNALAEAQTALRAMYDCRWKPTNLSAVQRAHDLAVAVLGAAAERQAALKLKEITPSNAELLQLADQHPAPQEWYDEAKGGQP